MPAAAARDQTHRPGTRRRRHPLRGTHREPLPARLRNRRRTVTRLRGSGEPGGRIALTTDSYVVNPLFFPGGTIGDLAVNGTVNDLACSGAQPLGLTAGFILEEGLELEVLGAIAHAMGRAAAEAGVGIVTGDTKVVGRGGADGLFINTAGMGVIPEGCGSGRTGPAR